MFWRHAAPRAQERRRPCLGRLNTVHSLAWSTVWLKSAAPICASIGATRRALSRRSHVRSPEGRKADVPGRGREYCRHFMRRDEINLVHSGTVGERYEALMSGETDAATLME